MRSSYTRPSFSAARTPGGASERTSSSGNDRNIIETPGWKRNRSNENIRVVAAADDPQTVDVGVAVDQALRLLHLHEAAGQLGGFLPGHQLHHLNALAVEGVVERRRLVDLAVVDVDSREEPLALVG